MATPSFIKRFRDTSLAKKLYFVVGIMALLILVELFTLWFAISTLSSVRAFVGGEGLWSKGQKDAVYSLQKYGHSRNEADFRNYLDFMRVPLGDHKTRLELIKKDPDLSIARQGFLEGRNHEDDIDGMINLFRRFHNIYYIGQAIQIWSAADSALSELIPISEQLHAEIISANHSQLKIDSLLNQVELLNQSLTILEDKFSFVLGEGSRWLENLILELLVAVALTVEISGLLLTISVSRRLQKGLNEILRASKNIAKGDFHAKAKTFSNDEIGVLANSFNHMAEELGTTTNSLKSYATKLEQSNASLKQFAYVASHDLKEPLRKIITFSLRLQDEYKDRIDDRGKTYLNKIEMATYRMQKLIDDILNISSLNAEELSYEKINLNKIMQRVLLDMEIVIETTHANITVNTLPVIEANPSQMAQLFQNIISNSLKFIQPNKQPLIQITAEEITGEQLQKTNGSFTHFKSNGESDIAWKNEKFCRITISDNGIGFDMAYAERIFEVFQKLNSSSVYQGTGIGLAICKKIIESHHGTITVNSRVDIGSVFTITIPVLQKNFVGK